MCVSHVQLGPPGKSGVWSASLNRFLFGLDYIDTRFHPSRASTRLKSSRLLPYGVTR